MKRFALVLCLMAVGCMVPDTAPGPAPDPKPGPATATHEAVTRKATLDWENAQADLCDQKADELEAGKYKALSQVFDAYKAADADLKDKRNKAIGQSFDRLVKPDAAFDPKKTAEAYRQQAAGFRRSGK